MLGINLWFSLDVFCVPVSEAFMFSARFGACEFSYPNFLFFLGIKVIMPTSLFVRSSFYYSRWNLISLAGLPPFFGFLATLDFV